MASRDKRWHVTELLDDIAIEALVASEEELRTQLSEAGVDPDRAISDARSIGANVVASFQRGRIASLPDDVPEDPTAVRSLLDQLLAMPDVSAQGLTLAFREGKEQSDHDVKLLTKHLLELVKRKHGG